MLISQHPIALRRIVEPPVEVQSLRLNLGFILNDEDVLIQGWCDGSMFYAVTDYKQACEIFGLEFFNDLESN